MIFSSVNNTSLVLLTSPFTSFLSHRSNLRDLNYQPHAFQHISVLTNLGTWFCMGKSKLVTPERFTIMVANKALEKARAY